MIKKKRVSGGLIRAASISCCSLTFLGDDGLGSLS